MFLDMICLPNATTYLLYIVSKERPRRKMYVWHPVDKPYLINISHVTSSSFNTKKKPTATHCANHEWSRVTTHTHNKGDRQTHKSCASAMWFVLHGNSLIARVVLDPHSIKQPKNHIQRKPLVVSFSVWNGWLSDGLVLYSTRLRSTRIIAYGLSGSLPSPKINACQPLCGVHALYATDDE